MILLSLADDTLFWRCIVDKSFQAFGVTGVFLVPGSESLVRSLPGSETLPEFILSPSRTALGLERDEVVVFGVDKGRLQDITETYKHVVAPTLRIEKLLRVDAGNLADEPFLGPDWYGHEGHYRWMPKRATLKIAGPVSAGQKLHVSGYCVPAQLEKGFLDLSVTVDGARHRPDQIRDCARPFQFEYPLGDA